MWSIDVKKGYGCHVNTGFCIHLSGGHPFWLKMKPHILTIFSQSASDYEQWSQIPSPNKAEKVSLRYNTHNTHKTHFCCVSIKTVNREQVFNAADRKALKAGFQGI